MVRESERSRRQVFVTQQLRKTANVSESVQSGVRTSQEEHDLS